MNLNKNFVASPGTELRSERESIMKSSPSKVFERKLSRREYDIRFNSPDSGAADTMKQRRDYLFSQMETGSLLKPDSAIFVREAAYISPHSPLGRNASTKMSTHSVKPMAKRSGSIQAKQNSLELLLETGAFQRHKQSVQQLLSPDATREGHISAVKFEGEETSSNARMHSI
jgi:hypothetical protein